MGFSLYLYHVWSFDRITIDHINDQDWIEKTQVIQQCVTLIRIFLLEWKTCHGFCFSVQVEVEHSRIMRTFSIALVEVIIYNLPSIYSWSVCMLPLSSRGCTQTAYNHWDRGIYCISQTQNGYHKLGGIILCLRLSSITTVWISNRIRK